MRSGWPGRVVSQRAPQVLPLDVRAAQTSVWYYDERPGTKVQRYSSALKQRASFYGQWSSEDRGRPDARHKVCWHRLNIISSRYQTRQYPYWLGSAFAHFRFRGSTQHHYRHTGNHEQSRHAKLYGARVVWRVNLPTSPPRAMQLVSPL